MLLICGLRTSPSAHVGNSRKKERRKEESIWWHIRQNSLRTISHFCPFSTSSLVTTRTTSLLQRHFKVDSSITDEHCYPLRLQTLERTMNYVKSLNPSIYTLQFIPTDRDIYTSCVSHSPDILHLVPTAAGDYFDNFITPSTIYLRSVKSLSEPAFCSPS
jgi:hypothetical protein